VAIEIRVGAVSGVGVVAGHGGFEGGRIDADALRQLGDGVAPVDPVGHGLAGGDGQDLGGLLGLVVEDHPGRRLVGELGP
jgi:hypothetical protein